MLLAGIFARTDASNAMAGEGSDRRQILQAYGRRLQENGSQRELLQAYGRRLSKAEGVVQRVQRLFGN